jgi:inosine-uridine nucleoside N-ribohydrolase
MAGLDVTHQFLVTHPRIDQVRTIGNRLTDLLADLFTFFCDNYVARHDNIEGAALHDPLAVMAVTHPDLFRGRDRHVTVETRGEYTTGMTVIDRRGLKDRAAPNAVVLEHVDDDTAWQLVLDALAAATP